MLNSFCVLCLLDFEVITGKIKKELVSMSNKNDFCQKNYLNLYEIPMFGENQFICE